MMTAYLDPKIHVLHPRVESRPESSVAGPLTRLRSLFSAELGCAHEELVFDEINDVYCKHCRKDFTG
jgi:hypothetical protein